MKRRSRHPIIAGVFLAGISLSMGRGQQSKQIENQLTFEVASIRPHEGNAMRKGPLLPGGPLIRLEGYTIFGLVMDAYDLRDFQLDFAPQINRYDIADTMYDISARAPGDQRRPAEDLRAMLRHLLEERFGLQVRRVTREMVVDVLEKNARSVSRLTPTATDGPCTVRTSLAPDGRNSEEIFTSCPVERVANSLTHLLGDRPVLDRSGLPGLYDLRLVALPYYRAGNHADPADIDPSAAVAKLGLKLVSQKAQVEILMIDRVQKPKPNE